jgi:hypothetical protein
MPLVAKALGGGAGAGIGEVPGYSGNRLVGYAAVPTIGWAVIAEEPSSSLDSLLAGALTATPLVIGDE